MKSTSVVNAAPNAEREASEGLGLQLVSRKDSLENIWLRPDTSHLTPTLTPEDIVYDRPDVVGPMFWAGLLNAFAMIAAMCILGVFVVFIVAIFSDAVSQGIANFVTQIWSLIR